MRMTYKKLFILFLFLIIVSLSISSVDASANTYNILEIVNSDNGIIEVEAKEKSGRVFKMTVKFKDSRHYGFDKRIDKNNFMSTYYNSKYSPQHDRSRVMSIAAMHKDYPDEDSLYGIVDAKIKFSKKVNGRTITTTKTYKANKWGTIDRQAPKGWKPISAVVRYTMVE